MSKNKDIDLECFNFLWLKSQLNARSYTYFPKVKLFRFGKIKYSKSLLVSIPNDREDIKKSALFSSEFNHLDYVGIRNIGVNPLNFFKVLTCSFFLNKRSPHKNLFLSFNVQMYMLIAKSLLKYEVKKVTFIGFAYDESLSGVAFFLKNYGVQVKFVVDTGFLDFCGPVVASEVEYRTKFQCIFHHKKNWYKYSESCSYRHKINLANKNSNKVVGVYTSGFYARQNTNSKKKYLKKGMQSERRMIKEIQNWASNRKDLEFWLYLHWRGKIENEEDARIEYASLLELDNVILIPSNRYSIEEFNDVSMSIACVSEIFFDRLELGYKSILCHSFEEDFLKKTDLEFLNARDVKSLNELSSMRFSDYKNKVELALLH